MASDSKPALQHPSAGRSIVSLLIFLHLFCVATVVLANFRRSQLQAQLVAILSPYTQLLNFDVDFTPYYLTHGLEGDEDSVMVVDLYPNGEEPVEGQTAIARVTLPDNENHWLGARRRYLALGKVLYVQAADEQPRDDVTGEIARAVARRLMDEHGAKRAVFRCVHRMTQPLDPADLAAGFPLDKPTDPRYDVTRYEADVWYDDEGQVQLVKRSGIGEVAPRASAPKAGAATRPTGK